MLIPFPKLKINHEIHNVIGIENYAYHFPGRPKEGNEYFLRNSWKTTMFTGFLFLPVNAVAI